MEPQVSIHVYVYIYIYFVYIHKHVFKFTCIHIYAYKYLYININKLSVNLCTTVQPGSVFLKTWRIRNDGVQRWPDNVVLTCAGGDSLAAADTYLSVDSLLPGIILRD
jgi:hypothetical protein